MAVDTKHTSDRRQLHFDSIDDLLAEAERLAAAGDVKTLGNWSLGHILKHLALGAITGLHG